MVDSNLLFYKLSVLEEPLEMKTFCLAISILDLFFMWRFDVFVVLYAI